MPTFEQVRYSSHFWCLMSEFMILIIESWYFPKISKAETFFKLILIKSSYKIFWHVIYPKFYPNLIEILSKHFLKIHSKLHVTVGGFFFFWGNNHLFLNQTERRIAFLFFYNGCGPKVSELCDIRVKCSKVIILKHCLKSKLIMRHWSQLIIYFYK